MQQARMESEAVSQSNQGEHDPSAPDSTEVSESVVNLTSTLEGFGFSEEHSSTDRSAPRTNYISWDDLFMTLAFVIAKRSKDPVTQVGACIVNNENKIVAMGYNGMPIGCHDKKFPWGKIGDPLSCKYMYVCHAEMNAVVNKNSADVKNCRIYVGLFPCNECAKIIIQSGIKEVVFLSDKNKAKCETVASKIMFDAAGVTYRMHKPKMSSITIDFSQVDWDNMSQLPATPDRSNT